jgi:hypothetical protein
MGKGRVKSAAMVLLASAICVLVGWGAREARVAGAATMLVASAPEAGLIAIAGSVPGRIRVLYARNGGMVLLREIGVPAGARVSDLSLSADGNDLFVATDAIAYAMSTRTGCVEAQALATDDAARGHPRARDAPG